MANNIHIFLLLSKPTGCKIAIQWRILSLLSLSNKKIGLTVFWHKATQMGAPGKRMRYFEPEAQGHHQSLALRL